MSSYPSWRYHRTEAAIIVNDPADEAERAPATEGWADTPAAFLDPEPESDQPEAPKKRGRPRRTE